MVSLKEVYVPFLHEKGERKFKRNTKDTKKELEHERS